MVCSAWKLYLVLYLPLSGEFLICHCKCSKYYLQIVRWKLVFYLLSKSPLFDQSCTVTKNLSIILFSPNHRLLSTYRIVQISVPLFFPIDSLPWLHVQICLFWYKLKSMFFVICKAFKFANHFFCSKENDWQIWTPYESQQICFWACTRKGIFVHEATAKSR